MRCLGAFAAVVALGLAAPCAAQAQSCQLPKGVQTANAQLQYDLTVEAALIERHTGEVVADPARAQTYAGQMATSARMLGGALGRYASRVVTAMLTEPPSC